MNEQKSGVILQGYTEHSNANNSSMGEQALARNLLHGLEPR
ncbi:hypothetical protein [Leptolyngbya sp. FACHB-321]|nr:hypothetical protein [Leptolyngbya sp. FACHB-321]